MTNFDRHHAQPSQPVGYIAAITEHDKLTNNWDGQIHTDPAEARRQCEEAERCGYPSTLLVVYEAPDARQVPPTCVTQLAADLRSVADLLETHGVDALPTTAIAELRIAVAAIQRDPLAVKGCDDRPPQVSKAPAFNSKKDGQ